jgi:hypothetical protein
LGEKLGDFTRKVAGFFSADSLGELGEYTERADFNTLVGTSVPGLLGLGGGRGFVPCWRVIMGIQ